MKLALLTAALLCTFAAACGNDRSCEIDADCFSGEYCSGEMCVVGTRPDNAEPNNDVTPDMSIDPDVSENNVGSPDMGSDDTGEAADAGAQTCQVDLIGNTCTDDEFEENDLYQADLPIPIAQESWCDGDTLVGGAQTFSGTICPGDQADLFRILIDNRMPNDCLADTFTIRMIVELDVPCDPADLVRILPYQSFQNPNTNSSCGQNDDLRCTVSDDLKTHTFEWVLGSEPLVDHRLFIAPREDDVQLDYTVTVDIIQ